MFCFLLKKVKREDIDTLWLCFMQERKKRLSHYFISLMNVHLYILRYYKIFKVCLYHFRTPLLMDIFAYITNSWTELCGIHSLQQCDDILQVRKLKFTEIM